MIVNPLNHDWALHNIKRRYYWDFFCNFTRLWHFYLSVVHFLSLYKSMPKATIQKPCEKPAPYQCRSKQTPKKDVAKTSAKSITPNKHTNLTLAVTHLNLTISYKNFMLSWIEKSSSIVNRLILTHTLLLLPDTVHIMVTYKQMKSRQSLWHSSQAYSVSGHKCHTGVTYVVMHSYRGRDNHMHYEIINCS